jgi:adenylate kinase
MRAEGRSDMMAVVLLGAPGAGKGTQAPILAERLGIPVVATGDLFRAAVREGTPVGLEARRFMDAGQLVPDDITIRLLKERLARPDAATGVILDGFPRTRAQAEALDHTLAEDGSRVERALFIDVPVEELIERMASRRICEANGHPFNLVTNPPRVAGRCDLDGSALRQRDDDKEATVRARMAQQIPPLEEVVDHYRGRGALVSVDGRQPIDGVTEALVRALGLQGQAV